LSLNLVLDLLCPQTVSTFLASMCAVASQKPLRMVASLIPDVLIPGILTKAINMDRDSIMHA